MRKSSIDDLHLLPKVRDSWSWLYVEHAKIEQDAIGVVMVDETGRTPVPAASLMVLMLGPGTTISQAAVQSLAKTGCLIAWTGEWGVRFYAQGLGETRSSRRLMHQARLWADAQQRLRVVHRMYRLRFHEGLPAGLTLQQLRGMEGVRVREAYAQAAREYGIDWQGRTFRREDWNAADLPNRALSCANSSLYGICQAAIVAAGYSTALGFIHTGKMLSFVYDIADLYKTDLTVPVAFRAAAEGDEDLERRVRLALRDQFQAKRVLGRIIDDIDTVLDTAAEAQDQELDAELASPGGLWNPDGPPAPGGHNYAPEDAE